MTSHIYNSSKRYWRNSLWLTVGLTFITLIVIQVFQINRLIAPLVVSSVFTLAVSFSYSFFWRMIATKHPDSLTAFYSASSGLRMLLALITMLAYYLIKGRSEMLPFIAVFMVFYMVMLIYHTMFFSKVAGRS